MGVLSDRQILEHLKYGADWHTHDPEKDPGFIGIKPFNKDHLHANGYDVTLANEYYELRPQNDAIDLGDPKWFPTEDKNPSSKLYRLLLASDSKPKPNRIALKPKGFLLCGTQEVVGSLASKNGPNYIPFFRTRSTLARLGISVDLTGIGDIGFLNRWGLEVYNFSDTFYLLPVGFRIGQIIFFESGPVENSYEVTGAYGATGREWEASDLLPKIRG